MRGAASSLPGDAARHAGSAPHVFPTPILLQAQSLFRSPTEDARHDASCTPGYTPASSELPSPRSSSSTNGEEECGGLPEDFVAAGWKRYESRSTGRSFFRNRLNGRTRWTCPHCYPQLEDATQGALVLLDRAPAQVASQDLPTDTRLDSVHNWTISVDKDGLRMASSAEQRRCTWGSALVEEDVYIGLVIESKPPHIVAEVKGVTDVNYVQQGAPEYANEAVHVGDTLVAVDGRSCSSAGVGGIQCLLKGVARTPVELTLARKEGRAIYRITVMRHRRDVQLDTELIHHEEYHEPGPGTLRAHASQVQDAFAKSPNQVMCHLKNERGIVGIRITSSKPFIVEAVSQNLTLVPGSLHIEVGDRLTSIDDQPVPSTLTAVHTLLGGDANTEVVLGLSRRSKLFSVRAIRHRLPTVPVTSITCKSAESQSLYQTRSKGTAFPPNNAGTSKVVLCKFHLQ